MNSVEASDHRDSLDLDVLPLNKDRVRGRRGLAGVLDRRLLLAVERDSHRLRSEADLLIADPTDQHGVAGSRAAHGGHDAVSRVAIDGDPCRLYPQPCQSEA